MSAMREVADRLDINVNELMHNWGFDEETQKFIVFDIGGRGSRL